MWFLLYQFLDIAFSVVLTVSVSGVVVTVSVSGHSFQCGSYCIRFSSPLSVRFLLYPFLVITFSVVLTVSISGHHFQFLVLLLLYLFLVIAFSVVLKVSVSGHHFLCGSYCSVSGHCFQCDSFCIRSWSLLLAWFLLYPFLVLLLLYRFWS